MPKKVKQTQKQKQKQKVSQRVVQNVKVVVGELKRQKKERRKRRRSQETEQLQLSAPFMPNVVLHSMPFGIPPQPQETAVFRSIPMQRGQLINAPEMGTQTEWIDMNKGIAEPLEFSIPKKERIEEVNWTIPEPVVDTNTKPLAETTNVFFETPFKDTEMKPNKEIDSVNFGVGEEDLIDKINEPFVIPKTITLESGVKVREGSITAIKEKIKRFYKENPDIERIKLPSNAKKEEYLDTYEILKRQAEFLKQLKPK